MICHVESPLPVRTEERTERDFLGLPQRGHVLLSPLEPAAQSEREELPALATVDDEGTGPYLETVGDFCCSFETILSPPSYRPNRAGSQGLDAFDGMPTEGVWTFTLTTTPGFSSGDGLHGWGLTITRAGAAVTPCCMGELSGDAVVDAADLGILLAGWGQPGQTDLDGDGTTNGADLAMLLAEWGCGDG